MNREDIEEVFQKPNEIKEGKVNPYKFDKRTPEELKLQARIMLSNAWNLYLNSNIPFPKETLIRQIDKWGLQAGYSPQRIIDVKNKIYRTSPEDFNQ